MPSRRSLNCLRVQQPRDLSCDASVIHMSKTAGYKKGFGDLGGTFAFQMEERLNVRSSFNSHFHFEKGSKFLSAWVLLSQF